MPYKKIGEKNGIASHTEYCLIIYDHIYLANNSYSSKFIRDLINILYKLFSYQIKFS